MYFFLETGGEKTVFGLDPGLGGDGRKGGRRDWEATVHWNLFDGGPLENKARRNDAQVSLGGYIYTLGCPAAARGYLGHTRVCIRGSSKYTSPPLYPTSAPLE